MARGISDEIVPSGPDDQVLALVEEEARIEKRLVSTGRVRVTTVADTVEELASASLEEEEVEVVRVPMDRIVTEAPAIRTEGDVTIIPVLEEVMVVQKQLVLREELHVRRRTTTEHVQIPVTLRKQRAIIERLDGAETSHNEENER